MFACCRSDHEPPPFVIVCDVGHCFEVYANFRRDGKAYDQFPDRQSFRIYLEDLREPEMRERCWRRSGAIRSRSIRRASPPASRAQIADAARRRLESAGGAQAPARGRGDVPHALPLHDVRRERRTYCRRTRSRTCLARCEQTPEAFPHDVGQLWEAMDVGDMGARAPPEGAALQRRVLPQSRGRCRSPARRSANCARPRATIGATWIPRSSGRCLNKRWTRTSAASSARITLRAPMSSGLSPPPSSSRCARTGGSAVSTAERQKSEGRATRMRWRRCAASTTSCARRACSIRPAAPGNFLYVSLEMMKRLEGEVLGGAGGPRRPGGADGARRPQRRSASVSRFGR